MKNLTKITTCLHIILPSPFPPLPSHQLISLWPHTTSFFVVIRADYLDSDQIPQLLSFRTAWYEKLKHHQKSKKKEKQKVEPSEMESNPECEEKKQSTPSDPKETIQRDQKSLLDDSFRSPLESMLTFSKPPQSQDLHLVDVDQSSTTDPKPRTSNGSPLFLSLPSLLFKPSFCS